MTSLNDEEAVAAAVRFGRELAASCDGANSSFALGVMFDLLESAAPSGKKILTITFSLGRIPNSPTVFFPDEPNAVGGNPVRNSILYFLRFAVATLKREKTSFFNCDRGVDDVRRRLKRCVVGGAFLPRPFVSAGGGAPVMRIVKASAMVALEFVCEV